MRSGLFTLATAAIFFSPLVVLAQSLGSVPLGVPFSISIDPQFPSPNSQATLSLLSDTLDLTNATMAVSVSGKKIYLGNVQPLAIPLGKTGSVTNVAVTIASGGANYSQTIPIQPQDVVLVAEPVSSAPPLYQGKPLVPLEGSVRVVALANLRSANGKALDSSTLAYAWTVDGTNIASASGIGKSALMVLSPLQYRARSVSVQVQSQDGSLVGGAELSLTSAEPIVRIYQNDPLLGIRFERALFGDHAISATEDTLYAAPFSLPTSSGAPLLQWFLNGMAAQTGNSITLRPTGSGEGRASLSLVASGGNSTTATAELSLSFGATRGFNFFGL